MRLLRFDSLTRRADERPTPSQLLQHPWIVKIMQKEVNMALWLRKVWGWKKRPEDRYASLPITPLLFASHPFDAVHLTFLFFPFPPINSFNSRSSSVSNSRMNRLLSRFTCTHNITHLHDLDRDDNVNPLLVYPARLAQAQVVVPKHQSRLPWRVFG